MVEVLLKPGAISRLDEATDGLPILIAHLISSPRPTLWRVK